MTKKTPIKRSKNLVLLSHEHHHGLVFCTRLKKAHQTDAKTLQLFVDDFWTNDLAPHFVNEEKWFLPEMENNEIKEQFIAEHQQIKTLVNCIKSSTKGLVELAVELSQVLNNHIRFEERIMFPYLEKTISANKLVEIGNALSEIEVSCNKFTPEFWKNEN